MCEEGRWRVAAGSASAPAARRPGRLGASIWRAWRRCRRYAHAMPCGRPEQALSSGALGTVLCWAKAIDARQTRRLQVAVAGSNSLAFVPSVASLGRVFCGFLAPGACTPVRVASWRSICSSGAARRVPKPFTAVPRPLKWRADHDSFDPSADCSTGFSTPTTLARTPPAFIAARSQRPLPSPSAIIEQGRILLADAGARQAGVERGVGVAAARMLAPAITLMPRPSREAAANRLWLAGRAA